jgi:ABC-2 type transport system ATP-binding protein
MGVLTPTSGNIEYFNKNFSENREEILEHLNFSSTYTNLPWRLTVMENLKWISHLYEIKDRKNRIKKICEIFKLQKLLDQELHELSAGQLTRVNLAKAFLNFPKILLLDEPTASLDPDVASYIRDFLVNERNKFQTSIIFTSHNMAEVEEICDRVVFINYGKIIADDTPDQLAKTIEVSHVELLIKDGLKRTVDYCDRENFTYQLEGRYIVVDIKEKEIPSFLRTIMDKGVFYDEISIEKPSLEDYFIQTARKK